VVIIVVAVMVIVCGRYVFWPSLSNPKQYRVPVHSRYHTCTRVHLCLSLSPYQLFALFLSLFCGVHTYTYTFDLSRQSVDILVMCVKSFISLSSCVISFMSALFFGCTVSAARCS